MSRSVPPELLAHIKTGSTTLCRLFTIILFNGDVYRFADGTRDVWFNGEKYLSDPGIEISAIRESVDDGYADANITLICDNRYISEQMVRNRLIVSALVEIEIINYMRPDWGSIFIYGGLTSDYILTSPKVDITVIGSGDAGTGITVGEIFKESCRNEFGDNRCRKDILSLRVPISVIGVEVGRNNTFYSSVRLPEIEDTNSELTAVSKENLNVGTGHYVVPNCAYLTVVLKGAGGSQKHPFSTTATPGGDSTFGPLSATGGGAGPKGAPGVGSGGDVNMVGGGSRGGGHVVPNIVTGYEGQDGGYTSKTFKIGEDFQIGDSIPYKISLGGSEGLTLGPPPIAGYQATCEITARNLLSTIDDGYNFGKIRWTKGDNKGLTHNVLKQESNGRIIISANLNNPIVIGDEGYFEPGCSKYRSNCMAYNNIINFRGEPDVPNIVPLAVVQNAVPDPIKIKGLLMSVGTRG